VQRKKSGQSGKKRGKCAGWSGGFGEGGFGAEKKKAHKQPDKKKKNGRNTGFASPGPNTVSNSGKPPGGGKRPGKKRGKTG